MKRKHGGRGLRPEEEALWNKVADTANPLKKSVLRESPIENLSVDPVKKIRKPAKPRDPIMPFKLGERASSKSAGHVISPSISEQVAGHALQLSLIHI